MKKTRLNKYGGDSCFIKINDLPYLKHLTSNEKIELCQQTNISIVHRGQLINKKSNSLYTILTGSYYLRAVSGHLLQFNWKFSSDNVSELGFFLSKRVANIIANNDCVVIEIPKEAFKKTITQSQYKKIQDQLQDLFIEKMNITNIFEFIKKLNIYMRSVYYFGFSLIALLLYYMTSIDIFEKINFSPEYIGYMSLIPLFICRSPYFIQSISPLSQIKFFFSWQELKTFIGYTSFLIICVTAFKFSMSSTQKEQVTMYANAFGIYDQSNFYVSLYIAAASILQQFFIRLYIHNPIILIFNSKNANFFAIYFSSMVFAMLHQYYSLLYTGFSFFVAVIIGYLYSNTKRNIFLATLSHITLILYVYFVLNQIEMIF
ncbi:CPBP family intramembrane metalloprotease [Gammaproteobacteria bacterium]|nr:CPBP family intramembrane metalloprotease [Gammaproteobacteria bacterium]